MDRVHLRRRKGRRLWEAYYTLDGRRVFHSLGTEDRRDAEDLRSELEFKLRRRMLHLSRPIPMETARDAFLAWQKGRREPRSLLTDEGYLKRALDAIGLDDLQKLDDVKVRDYLQQKRKEEFAPKTLNRIREVLHTFCRWAVKQKYIAQNPIALVERYHEPAPDIRYVPKSQQAAFLALFREKDPLLLPLVATCLYAGLRRSEAVWLRVTDVDVDAGIIRVRARRPGEDGKDGWQPKTRRNRGIPISPELRAILEAAMARHNGSPWAFPSPEGGRWDVDNLTHRFRAIAKAGKMDFTLLDLRHTFGTMLAMKGKSTFMIANLMGNSEAMVRRHYAAFLLSEVQPSDVAF